MHILVVLLVWVAWTTNWIEMRFHLVGEWMKIKNLSGSNADGFFLLERVQQPV